MPVVNFNNIVDDDGTGTTGTILDKAQIQGLLLGGMALGSVVTGAVNNWAPGLAGHTFLEWQGTSDVTISGLAGGRPGQQFVFRNVGTKVAYFPHQSGLSSAGNKFVNSAASAPTPVAAGGCAAWVYDGTNWILVGHIQGAWVTPLYAAANFTGSGGMTWTVDAGDVVTCAYLLRGSTLRVALRLIGTTTAGAGSNVLNVGNGAWGGFAAAVTILAAFGQLNDGAGVDGGNALVSGAALQISKITGAVFGLGVNTVNIQGGAEFPVT